MAYFTSPWNDDLLDKMRLSGDEKADKIAEVLWKHRNRNVMADLKFLSTHHDKPLAENIDKLNLEVPLTAQELSYFDDYYQHIDGLSKAYTKKDLEHFELNQEVFREYGYLITFLLFFKSLPTGYMCPKPGLVLHTTKLLENFAARRVMETAQFIFAVNNADWYKRGSKGLRSIEQVRLMHAGMRMAMLKNNNPEKQWDLKNGVPINQEDLTLTNHLFSLAIISGLDAVGIHLNQEERLAVFHTWQKIGEAMGIRKEMLNSSYEDAWSQYLAILDRQKSVNNPSGPPLTKALLKSMKQMMHKNIPMHTLENATKYLLYDSDTAQSLGLKKSGILQRILFKLLYFFLNLRLWRLFYRNSGDFARKIINRAGNYFLIKYFKLGPYLITHPDHSPLVSFTKVMLQNLTKRDLKDFGNMNPETIEKSFFVDAELYKEWDLGGFDLHVDVMGGHAVEVENPEDEDA